MTETSFERFDRVHKDLFNQEGVRRAVLERAYPNTEVRFLDISLLRAPPDLAWASIGTIYEDFGDGTAHYLAYRKYGRVVTIFDPSGSSGPYAADAQAWEDKYWPLFPGAIRVVDSPGVGPQHFDQDTLCQTWSLAWLLGMYRQIRDASHEDYEPYQEIREIFRVLREHVEAMPRSVRRDNWLREFEMGYPQLREYFSDRQVPRPRAINFAAAARAAGR